METLLDAIENHDVVVYGAKNPSRYLRRFNGHFMVTDHSKDSYGEEVGTTDDISMALFWLNQKA